jgi:hypothetical protein
MAGNTATINIVAFRADWATHMPISALCQRYSITKDQTIRLRDVWQLPLRNDRRLRFKPLRQRDPTAREIAQACREIQARWDANTRHERQVTKPTSFEVREVELPPDLRTFGEGE